MVSGDEASKGHIDQVCVGGGGKQGCLTVNLCPSWYDGPLMGKGGAMLRQLFPLKLSTALHRRKNRSFTFHRTQVLQKPQSQFSGLSFTGCNGVTVDERSMYSERQ
jgi:hypothetical protein